MAMAYTAIKIDHAAKRLTLSYDHQAFEPPQIDTYIHLITKQEYTLYIRHPLAQARAIAEQAQNDNEDTELYEEEENAKGSRELLEIVDDIEKSNSQIHESESRLRSIETQRKISKYYETIGQILDQIKNRHIIKANNIKYEPYDNTEIQFSELNNHIDVLLLQLQSNEKHALTPMDSKDQELSRLRAENDIAYNTIHQKSMKIEGYIKQLHQANNNLNQANNKLQDLQQQLCNTINQNTPILLYKYISCGALCIMLLSFKFLLAISNSKSVMILDHEATDKEDALFKSKEQYDDLEMKVGHNSDAASYSFETYSVLDNNQDLKHDDIKIDLNI